MKNKTLISMLTVITVLSIGGGCSPVNNLSSKIDSQTNGFEVSSDDDGSATVRIFKDNESTSKSRFVPPNRVKMKYSYNTLSGTLSNNENVSPSIGDVNLLVIPVHLPNSNGDDKTYMTDAVKSDIEKMFFSSNDSRLGFKSVTEFFKESSFGKLNFKGKVTDWFDATSIKDSQGNQVVKTDKDITSGPDGTIVKILNAATEWAFETQGINRKDYDVNKDGSLDGVWLVYDHLDWTTQFRIEYEKNPSLNENDVNSTFWNFTGWDTTTLPDVDNPTTSAFSWASFDMMYTPFCDRNSNDVPQLQDLTKIPLDSHTFIHETGHILGLDDYYSSSDSSYSPTGGATMMDQNICDFDSYSKMLLGWITPYVVYGTSEIVIPTVTSSDHAVIVIPTDYETISDDVERAIKRGTIDEFTYEFNPFSEYLMIDLYSPDGLNYQDTFGPTIYGKDTGPTETGVRIYHVDSRIFKCNVIQGDGVQRLDYVEGYVWDGEQLEDNQAILMPISNNNTESSQFQLPSNFNYFDQIRLLEASGNNSFNNGAYASNSTLWKTSTEPFTIDTFAYQFFNGNYAYNDGTELPFKIQVNTLKGIKI